MTETLRVLMVEDVENDAVLVARELRNSGRPLHIERVEDPDAMRAALERGPWDLVISDWSMPRFSALGALGIVKEMALDLPFIIVSGTIGEEMAFEAMRAGARDYVLKERLTRLVPAVERELRESAARRAHRQNTARRMAIVETALDAIVSMDHTGAITEFNPAAERTFGYTRAEVLGRQLAEVLIPPRTREAHRKGLARFLSTREGPVMGRRVELTAQRRDGSTFPGEVAVTCLDSEDPPSFTAFIRDISERRCAEDALRESEAAQRMLFDANPLPVFLFDAVNLQFLACNDAVLDLYGYTRDEFLALSLPDLRPSRNGARSAKADLPANFAEWRGAAVHQRKDGSLRDVEVTTRSLTLDRRAIRMSVILDVTARLALEEQLRQAQKMEAVGRLAGGVAHDFNNMLSVILSYGELILDDLPPGDVLRDDVEQICHAGRRAADITRQLLMFSRQQVLEPRVLDLNEVLLDMDRMLRRLLGEDIEMVSRPAQPLGRVKADRGSLEQIIMNLVVNARDAMPRGGRLTMETGNVVLDQDDAKEHLDVVPGPHVTLSVTDSGIGMDKATTARIFEPFFTTKAKGKGTGLGLSTVFGIVRQSGGSVRVHSERGHGTTLKIYLPRVDAALEAARAPLHTTEVRGAETILLVEDEDQIRIVVRGILQKCGYTVVEARNGLHALQLCEVHSRPLDLLLTDVVMPHMSGPDLAKRLAKGRPELRVLYMSGYTDDSVVRHGLLDESLAFVQKPITPDMLTRRVREVLDAPTRPR